MIEHEPWKGPYYEAGIDGQRIAIVGHSHHGDCDNDRFTLDTVADVISGRQNLRFFNQISSYFDFQDRAEFWNRVLFFNYLPDAVGADEERYKFGTPEQIKRAMERFLRLITKYHPQKVFVFSKGMWPELPPSREQGPPLNITSGEIEGDGFVWCTYDSGDQIVMAFGLEHPERAPKEPMRQAVQRILAMPLTSAQRIEQSG